MSVPVTNELEDGASGDVVVLHRHAAQASQVPSYRGTRGLSTARAVLRVLSLMAQHPEGVTARQVARELEKSISTAYYLLASLLEEGFAERPPGQGYRLRAHPEVAAAAPEASADSALSRTVHELFTRTHRRTYLGQVEQGAIVITTTCGRQGIPRVPGLEAGISRNAHALALGKVVLSLLPEAGRRRYVERGLPRYTPSTITAPAALLSELVQVRRDGFAIDRGEFHAAFCCVAAPVFGDRGRFQAVLGLSTSSRTFETHAQELVRAVRELAAGVGGGPVREGATVDAQAWSDRRQAA